MSRLTLSVLFASATALTGLCAYQPVTHTWVGGDAEGPLEWNVAANWDTGVVPTNAADTCVFDKGAGYTNTITRTSVPGGLLPSITVLSGSITLSGQLTLPKGDNKEEKAYNPGNVTNVFHVASGAQLTTSTKLGPYASGTVYGPALGIRKTGGGRWLQSAQIGTGSGSWNVALLEVVEGCTEIRCPNPVIQNVVVRNGGVYYANKDRALWENTVFTIDKGGELWLNVQSGNNPSAKAKGFKGEGDVIVKSGWSNDEFRLTLANGPYRFSGRIYSDYSRSAIFRTGVDGTGTFVVCSSNTLAATAGTGKLSYNPQVSPVWGRGVGEFWSMPIIGKAGVPVPTADEDGEPITLHAAIDAATAVTGPGSWFASGSGSTTITGAQVSVSGTIGSDSGATLVLGNGADAGADVDVSSYAGLVPNGNLTFNNVGSQTVPYAFAAGGNLTVSGPVDFSSDVSAGGDVTFDTETTVGGDLTAVGKATFNAETTVSGALRAGSISVNAPTTLGRFEAKGIVGGSGDLTVKSGEIRGTVAVGAGTITFENTRVFGGYGTSATYDTVYTTLRPEGVLVQGSSQTSRLVVGEGANVIVRKTSPIPRLPSFVVRDGGRLTLNGAVWGYNDEESALTATLDGGTIVLSSWFEQYGFNIPAANTSSMWKLMVGAKGGVFENNAAHSNGLSNHLRYYDYLTAESGVVSGRDGGLTFAVQASYNINRPKRITGPLVIKDGLVRFVQDAFIDVVESEMVTNAAISLGSLVLDGGALVVGDALTTDRRPLFANADGAEFVYRGSATLELGQSDNNGTLSARSVPQTYTIGPAGAADSPLVRGGKGAVLRLSDHEGTNPVGSASGNKVFVNGGVETRADGLVLAPVFSTRQSKMNFLKYDAVSGFTEFADSDYATSLDAGSDKVVRISGTETTLSSDATIMGLRLDYAKNKPLTIASGATLTVGDGTHPAAIILNTVYESYGASWAAIDGAGAIDFGGSEGLFVKPERAHLYFEAPPIVSAAIHGRNGVTFVGDSLGQNPIMEVSGANDYSGGTYIDMIEVQATGVSPFGVGPVTVRGRRLNGGAAAFGSARTYTNDFVITGYGKNENCFGSYYSRGALHFRANGTVLTGAVRVDEYARITSCDAPENSTNTIAGVISGGSLQFLYGATSGKKFVLGGHNTLTGAVEILQADVVLKGASPSLGTGEVLVDSGVLEFANEGDIVFPNDMRGNGTVRLNGADVAFTGDTNADGANALRVDLAGCSPVLKGMPPFSTITNSAIKAANVTLAADATVSPSAYAYLTPNVNLTVADGATVTIPEGETLTVRRLTIKGSGRVVGDVVETNPRKGVILIVL